MQILKKSWMMLLAAAVLCASAAALRAQEASLPSTVVPANKLDEDWWKERHEQKKARIAEGKVELLLLGDSIINGFDGYGKAVQEYYYGDRNFANMGIGGDRTEHLLWRMNDAPMENIHPKAAMLLIGVNNLGGQENYAEDVSLGIKANVDKLTELYPDMPILLLYIFPAHETADNPVRAWSAATNAKLPEMFKNYKNVTLMDLSHLWVDENGTISKDLMYDFVHPTEYGYKLWCAEVEPWISEKLGDAPKAKME